MDISGLDANLFAAYGSAGGHGHEHAGGVYDHAHDAGSSMVGEDSLWSYVDHDRVTEIRKAIETNSYPLIPTEIADAIIAAGLYGKVGK